jgi:putative cardiolipin synthase
MHNKAWIADNRIAIAGGRNIGDEYFSAGEGVNFIDLDFAILGPAVDKVSASFNKYWNSAAVWPMATLSPQLVNQQTLNKIRTNATAITAEANASPWIQALADNDTMQQIQSGALKFHWTDSWQVLSDDPLKALGADDPLVHSTMLRGFFDQINQSKSSIVLISPYFVPGKKGSQLFIDAAKRGPSVTVLTNSLASNDVVPVHGGYSKYRNRLIKGGVQLWELKPTAKQNANTNLTGSSGASLHSKSAVFDNETTFVGSFNLDPRSVSLNCEQGVFATHPAMSRELATLFARLKASETAWRVDHTTNGKLRWSDGTHIYYVDPDANFFRRLKASLFRLLPLDSQL